MTALYRLMTLDELEQEIPNISSQDDWEDFAHAVFAQIAALRLEHATEIESLYQEHSDEIGALHDTHADEINEMQERHDAEIDDLRADHADEINTILS